MNARVIKHEVKLETSVKVILAALAFGVMAHALVPAVSAPSAFAATTRTIGGTSGLGTITVRMDGPLNLGGQIGIGGNLGLGGAVKCIGCAPK